MSDALAVCELPNRKVLQRIGDFAGPTALFFFGAALWYYQASENLFTFAAWGALDVFTALSMYNAGAKKEALLPVAYGLIAFLVTAIIYRNGHWQWTNVETICLIGTFIAFVLWLSLGAVWAVVAFGLAALIASIPIIVSTYENPQSWEWWLWLGSGISATIGIYLVPDWTIKGIQNWMFVVVSEFVTVIMLVLLLATPFMTLLSLIASLFK